MGRLQTLLFRLPSKSNRKRTCMASFYLFDKKLHSGTTFQVATNDSTDMTFGDFITFTVLAVSTDNLEMHFRNSVWLCHEASIQDCQIWV